MRTIPLIALSVSLFTTAQLSAQERPEPDPRRAELALSEDTFQLSYIAPETLSDEFAGHKAFRLFVSESRDLVGTAAMLIDSDLHLLPGLTIALGPQAYVALLSENNEDAVALAFGLQARMDLDRRRGLAVVGHAFYAPDILSFGSADNLSDYMARAELRLTQRLLGFGGYRWFEIDEPLRDRRTLQREVFAGVQWQLK